MSFSHMLALLISNSVCVEFVTFTNKYSAALVCAGYPASYELVADEVRPHLASIVRQQEVTDFPFVRHCYCDGQAGGRMVGCDGCHRWFHLACLSGEVGPGDWLCRLCK